MEETLQFHNSAYKKKADFVLRFVQKNFNRNLLDFIIDNNWEENANLCVNVINDTLSIKQLNYINEKLNIPHLKDRRTPPEYACDLILGWVVEDGILKILSEKVGLQCNLSSADKKRKFIKKPTATADIKVNLNETNSIALELVKDYTGYWLKNRRIELRDNKYINLKADNGFLLGLEFIERKFFILEVNNVAAKYIKFHFPFHKPAYSLSLEGVEFYDQSNLKTVLNTFFEKFLDSNKDNDLKY